jgi:hypothetical protein
MTSSGGTSGASFRDDWQVETKDASLVFGGVGTPRDVSGELGVRST